MKGKKFFDYIYEEYLQYYIPTWVICVFMLFGRFVWCFAMALILLLIQYLQRKKEIEKVKIKEEEIIRAYDSQILNLENTCKEEKEYIRKIEIDKNSEIQKLIEETEKLQSEISDKNSEIHILKEKLNKNMQENKNKIDELQRQKNKLEEWTENAKAQIADFKLQINVKQSEHCIFLNNLRKEVEEIKKQKNILEKEILNAKQEYNTINNDLIEKYYRFSDYNNITSAECKNKLFLLKEEERNLRQIGNDVIVTEKNNGHWNLFQRTVRQILRSFNMECDNIMLNVGLKNIDQSRKKIQQSFKTLNELYYIDGVELSRKILELKLEQITLMYTYELKYQQEKELQREIKEQMLEEAKAQREIETQKKKIEKDLQQHLGEINRMMKYMQKTQIDAEKQLYMDKIKELEEKIKVLESDKETVLEREANAKAGFVYIISNIGSFGEDIYKIGMTRRLEPMDRVKELSSASVPFEFDVHAMIFSSDAPELETTLHKHFADKAVNKVNPRKEFYNVDIDEIEKIVKENYNDTVQFTKIPIAAEYRQSLNLAEK